MKPNQSSARLLHIATIPATFMFLAGQVEHMSSRGMDVHTLSSTGTLPRDFADNNHQHHTVTMTRSIAPAKDLAALHALINSIREIRPTIVHSHTPKAGLLGMIAAWFTRVPVRVYHIHGLPFVTAKGRKKFILRFTEKLACKLAHQVICVSPSLREVVISEKFCPSHKIKVLCQGSINGVDALGKFNPESIGEDVRRNVRRKYSIPEDAFVIGFVGRVVGDKGICELAEAWRRLREEFVNIHLMMVGDFEKEDAIPDETAKALRNDARVHLTGVFWDPMPPLFRAMDIITLPTYREGFPVVPLEAAAMELPVVATTVPGCTDAVVDGVTGTLIPPRDPQALINAIRRYITDNELCLSHGRAARKRVIMEFRPRDIWEATYTEYSRLLSKSGLAN